MPVAVLLQLLLLLCCCLIKCTCGCLLAAACLPLPVEHFSILLLTLIQEQAVVVAQSCCTDGRASHKRLDLQSNNHSLYKYVLIVLNKCPTARITDSKTAAEVSNITQGRASMLPFVLPRVWADFWVFMQDPC
jgi:hypothetical protein